MGDPVGLGGERGGDVPRNGSPSLAGHTRTADAGLVERPGKDVGWAQRRSMKGGSRSRREGITGNKQNPIKAETNKSKRTCRGEMDRRATENTAASHSGDDAKSDIVHTPRSQFVASRMAQLTLEARQKRQDRHKFLPPLRN